MNSSAATKQAKTAQTSWNGHKEHAIQVALLAITAELLEEWDLDGPYEINKGFCFNWAENAEIELEEADVEVWEANPNECLHRFIKCNGLFRDAERVDGVKDWKDLPFFKREIKKRERWKRKKEIVCRRM